MLASILKQVTLTKKLSYDVNVFAGFILLDEFDNVGMVALFENTDLSL